MWPRSEVIDAHSTAHHGVHSPNVVSWLREQGIADCQSMSGGIDAGSLMADPAVPRH